MDLSSAMPAHALGLGPDLAQLRERAAARGALGQSGPSLLVRPLHHPSHGTHGPRPDAHLRTQRLIVLR